MTTSLTPDTTTPTVDLAVISPSLDDGVLAVEVERRALEFYDRPRLSLRDLAYEAMVIDAILTETEGELSPLLEERCDRLAVELMKKADGIADYTDALSAEIATFKAEEKRLADIRKTFEARLARFRDYVKTMLLRMGTKRLDGQFGRTIRIARTKGSLVIERPELIPDECKKTEVVVSVVNDLVRTRCTEDGAFYLETEIRLGPDDVLTWDAREGNQWAAVIEREVSGGEGSAPMYARLFLIEPEQIVRWSPDTQTLVVRQRVAYIAEAHSLTIT